MSVFLLLLLPSSLSLALLKFVHCGMDSADQLSLLSEAVSNLLLAEF